MLPNPRHPLQSVAVLGAVALAGIALAQGQNAPAGFRASIEPFLEQHCYDCHDDFDPKAGLNLLDLDFDAADPGSLAAWTRVHDRIVAGEMPPKKKPRPAVAEVEAFAAKAERTLEESWRQVYATSGRVGGRRLNPVEYEHTLRDLLAAPWLELKEMLPPDPEAHGFDNVAEAQEISYVQMARYLEAAEVAIDSAMMLRPAPEPTTERVWFSGLGRYIGKGKLAGKGAGDGRLVGDRLVLIRQPNSAQTPYNLENKRQREPGWYRFRTKCRAVTYDSGKLLPPERGVVASINTAAKRVLGSFDVPEGEDGDVVEFIAWQHQDELLEFFSSLDDRNDPNWKKDPTGPYRAPGIALEYFEIEGPFPSQACERDEAKRQWPPESYRRLFGDLPTAPWTPESGLKPPELLHIPDLTANKRGLRDSFQPPVENYMVVSKNPRVDAERLLRDFMERAYRRPPEESEVQRCLAFAINAIAEKACFQDAMRLAFKAALCSPDFLYLREKPGPLDGYALAARLSYFLWRTMPDATLLDAAEAGMLKTRAGLLAQLDRLLADPKAARFVSDFCGQWLDLRKVHDTSPDRYLFPEYFCDTHLVDSAVVETEATFAEMLRNDLPAITTVDADFVMVNERLAEVYCLPRVRGMKIRRVSLPPDSPYGGFLTQSSVMKVTANGLTTSPVLRGAWILDRILGTPPAAPPPDAGAIEPDTRGATTIRELLEKHRRSESCASCHVEIDPPGFALENFDVMGAWRERYRSFDQGETIKLRVADRPVRYKLAHPVDASGETSDGEPFRDIHEFRRHLVAREEQIARNLVERLLTIATGAGPTFADREIVEEILESTKANRHGLRSIVREIVLSDVFQSK